MKESQRPSWPRDQVHPHPGCVSSEVEVRGLLVTFQTTGFAFYSDFISCQTFTTAGLQLRNICRNISGRLRGTEGPQSCSSKVRASCVLHQKFRRDQLMFLSTSGKFYWPCQNYHRRKHWTILSTALFLFFLPSSPPPPLLPPHQLTWLTCSQRLLS